MQIQIPLILLVLISTLTALTVEAIKKMLLRDVDEKHSNVIAAVVAVVLAVAVSAWYCVANHIGMTVSLGFEVAAMCFLSWLCAMVGYDKVMEALGKGKVLDKEKSE